MRTVPLLTREGEIQIAKRIERGKLSIIKVISRTPTIAKAVVRMGEQLTSGDRTIRELVIFRDDEVTDERIDRRARNVMAQIETVRKIRLDVVRREKKVRTVPKREKRRYRRNYRNLLRARRESPAVRAGQDHPHGGLWCRTRCPGAESTRTDRRRVSELFARHSGPPRERLRLHGDRTRST